MTNIIEASELPDGDKVYLKKDWAGWRTVQPYKNPDGSMNFPNVFFGGKRNLVTLVIYILIALLIWYGVNEMTASMRHAVENPCDYCDCQLKGTSGYSEYVDSLRLNYTQEFDWDLGGENG